MLENRFLRAGVFFAVAFGVPVLLALATGGTLDRGVEIGVITGIVFAVMSQFFEPAEGSVIEG